MAITIDDFSKIWASTSPLTPYEFSENNYKSGWNFIGSTPPSRQMWDFLQKNNDEKMQYLADNYLPLSGGIMTGTTIFDGSGIYSVPIRQKYDSAALRFFGGTDDSSANLWLFGKNSAGAGRFDLIANDGTGNKTLRGLSDGTLTWDGKTVIVGTEATETTTFASINGSSYVTFAVAHNPKYYSVSLSGTGFAEMCVTKDPNRTFYVRNTGTNTRTNITITVNYIY